MSILLVFLNFSCPCEKVNTISDSFGDANWKKRTCRLRQGKVALKPAKDAKRRYGDRSGWSKSVQERTGRLNKSAGHIAL